MEHTGILHAAAAAVFLCLAPVADADEPSAPALVEMVICLDTSGSMEGLIDAARQKLWAIVNDLATARPTPRFRLALLTFGNTGNPADVGWVKVETDFTEDLDMVSERLFALRTNGGDEYVGRVLQAAVDQLAWTGGAASPQPGSNLRLIFVAGNESADQDQEFGFRAMCRQAIARGIMVNSIYCGNPADDIAPGWREVAKLADGHFAAIDQQNGTVAIATPFDDELAALGAAINATYLPLGSKGEAGKKNQLTQDANAGQFGAPASAQRAAAKGGRFYRCSWDLVDACREGEVKLEEVAETDLPEEMRAMTLEERRAHVAAMEGERAEIQKRIAAIDAKRRAFVAEEMKKHTELGELAFDKAVREAVRSQATAKGFEFED